MNLNEVSAALEDEGIGNIVVAGNTEEVDNLLEYLSKVKLFRVKKEIENLSDENLSALDKCYDNFMRTYWDCFIFLNTTELYKDPNAEFAMLLYLYIVKYKKSSNSDYAILKNRYNKAAINAVSNFLKEESLGGSKFKNMCDSYMELGKQVENTLEEFSDMFG